MPATGLTSVVELRASSYSTCARRTSGAVECWGRNEFGQFGNGTANASMPAASGFPVATAIATGGTLTDIPTTGQTCALTATGAVWCSGGNTYGQLGDGTTTPRSTPVTMGLVSTSVGAGTWHTCAVTSGQVACWGRNDVGQLGRGAATAFELGPALVPGLVEVGVVTAGRDQTCAVLSDRTLWCWGGNARGQVGDGTLIDRHSPVEVPIPCS